jgi:hypothetical protein
MNATDTANTGKVKNHDILVRSSYAKNGIPSGLK